LALPAMAQPDNMEDRVVALKPQVRDLTGRTRSCEQDAVAARGLPIGAAY